MIRKETSCATNSLSTIPAKGLFQGRVCAKQRLNWYDCYSAFMKTNAPDQHPHRRTDLMYRNVDGETVILNREGGVLHRLNPTAAFIWDCCDGTVHGDEIVRRLADTYDIDSETCRKDVNEILGQFQSLNLLASG